MVDASATTSTRDRFFVAGMELLAEEGYGALKLATLCRRVGVTTGSFYHSFRNWQDYTQQLIEYWRVERTERAAELARAEVDPAQRIELLLRLGVSLPHSAEAAIRVWSGVEPDVGAVQESVDRDRLAAVTEAFEDLTGDAAQSADLAHAAFYLVIGFEQSTGDHDVAVLERILRALQERALGQAVQAG